MSTLNSIIERDDETGYSTDPEDDMEQVYLQRHLDSGASFTEVRSRTVGALEASRWYRESSAWSQARNLIEEMTTASDPDALSEIIDDLRALAPDEGVEIL